MAVVCRSDGVGHFYGSKQEAIAAVLQFQAAGAVSIDVGCMQVNLRYHPTAFASLDEAFTPAANTAYAARFLRQLYRQTGDWTQAAGYYHSQTPALEAAYRDRVLAIWPMGKALATAAADPALQAASDPHHVMTDAYRARLIADARFRMERNARMHVSDNAALAQDASMTASLDMAPPTGP